MDETVRIIDESLALLSRPHVLVPPSEEDLAVENEGLDTVDVDDVDDDGDPALVVTPLRAREQEWTTAPTGRGPTDEEHATHKDRSWSPRPASSFGTSLGPSNDDSPEAAHFYYVNGSRRPQTAPRRLLRGRVSASSSGQDSAFRGEAVAAVTSQLLSAQAQCRALEDEKLRLEELLRASNRFLPPQPPPTKGQTTLAKALQALEAEVSRRSASAASSPRNASKVLVDRLKAQGLAESTRETRSQVANLKVLLASSTETNAELEETLSRVKQEHARRVSELEAQVHTAREAAAAARARSPRSERTPTLVDEEKVQRLEQELVRVKEQYLRLYEYCQDQERAHQHS
ncbi:Hypothetical Protein FCC1311_096742 [Hondaea fermentalgiana]|uniref:Uncharacterized protein n=1 Tax=Hondaea fermentalgiana TaxID=2315210 RepID=A0A2R5GYC0_9STRA|nr:Hypothetical Protein FCC1311_096742 [Hondaea fermentalgiana]|eukprot:GBG33451.1 Hypothetical Protein FCC1311_096742 [Hondaea fermentalgiana]